MGHVENTTLKSFSLLAQHDHICASSHTYMVDIGMGSLSKIIFNDYHAIIIDQCVWETTSFLKEKMKDNCPPIYTVSVNETNKSLETLESIWAFFAAHNLSRKNRVLIVGGGIMHDLGALAAALYKRGILWDFIPTTLLSMVDACIGGKCAVNAGGIKNAIGTIYPPQRVIIDVNFLETLPEMQILSGLAEVAKAAFLADQEAFDMYLRAFSHLWDKNTNRQNAFITLIRLGLAVKKAVIEIDEFDTGIRQYLNFGHTFGHAIEAATQNAIDHGLAVAIGMRCAIQFARLMGHDNSAMQMLDQHLANDLLGKNPKIKIDIQKALRQMNWDTFWSAFCADKKQDGGNINLILPCTQNGYSTGKLQLNDSVFSDSTPSDYGVSIWSFPLGEIQEQIHIIFNDLLL